MKGDTRTCGKCRFCIEQKGDPAANGIGSVVLYCFRNPPVATVVPARGPGGAGLVTVNTRPAVAKDEPACGEYKERILDT